MLEQLPLITGAIHTPPSRPTQPRSLLPSQIKAGEITPEQALEAAFPSTYSHIKDISVEDLKIEVLPSGFKVLDDNFFLKRGKAQLVTVAAATSHGKSAILLQIAANVSRIGPVFVHSFEMEHEDLKARLLAPRIDAPLEDIIRGRIPLSKLHKADSDFAALNMHLACDSSAEVVDVERQCVDMAKKVGNPALLVVDYLQYMHGPTNHGSIRTLEIRDIMQRLKALAERLECPVLMGSQLNRECERRGKAIEARKGVGEYKPAMLDLADCSKIGHDSDIVLFVTRQEQYDGTRPGEADFVCAKNRGGKRFEAQLKWSGSYCSFYEEVGL